MCHLTCHESRCVMSHVMCHVICHKLQRRRKALVLSSRISVPSRFNGMQPPIQELVSNEENQVYVRLLQRRVKNPILKPVQAAKFELDVQEVDKTFGC